MSAAALTKLPPPTLLSNVTRHGWPAPHLSLRLKTSRKLCGQHACTPWHRKRFASNHTKALANGSRGQASDHSCKKDPANISPFGLDFEHVVNATTFVLVVLAILCVKFILQA